MSFDVGDRVGIQGHKATVRYVGEVEGQHGQWLGLEWDDEKRGKHDGCVNGVRYFSCSNGAAAASFVRVEKVPTGLSVSEALHKRYKDQQDVSADDMYVSTAGRRRKTVELVGADKVGMRQGRLDKLQMADLHALDISSAGPPTELASTAPALEELDVSDNLISSVVALQQITDGLSALRVLNASANRISWSSHTPADFCWIAQHLNVLVLNNTGFSFAHLHLLSGLQSLQELHLCDNSITATLCSSSMVRDADQALPLLPQLNVLNLDDNRIADWNKVLALSRLTALTRLQLNNNPLPSIHGLSRMQPTPQCQPHDTNDTRSENQAVSSNTSEQHASTQPQQTSQAEKHPIDSTTSPSSAEPSMPAAGAFAKLQVLLLGGTEVSRWADVDELAQLPQLLDVRLTNTPLLREARGGGRFEMIARLPTVRRVNGAEVRKSERYDSELRYLRLVCAEAGVTDACVPADLAVQHPRLQSLIQRYGAVSAGPAVQQQTAALISSAAELKLTCVAASAGKKMGTVQKKLPTAITVAKLKALCQQLFKMDASKQALYLRVPDDPMPQMISEDESRDLNFFGVENGSEILIDEISA